MIGDKNKIFLVDDDAVYLQLLKIELQQLDEYDIETYATGELCISSMHSKPNVIILDYHLDGIDPKAMNGIATLDKIHALDSKMTVIILSSQDKIEVAIDCMHHSAHDYVVKSETATIRLQQILSKIFQYKKMEEELNWYIDRM